MEQTEETAAHHHEEDDHHPSPLHYVKIAGILAVVTAVEVVIFYVPSLRAVLVPSLLVLSIVKFAMVALYFMHLKFDSLIFRRLFMVGIVLALAVYAIVLATFFTR